MKIRNFMNFAKRLIVGTVLINLGACASVISGNDTTTTVNSDPTEAKCIVNGEEYTTSVTTPMALEIPTSAAPLTVSCEKLGFFRTEVEISTDANPWILGNALIGGGIGLIIDLASGSGVKLPSQIVVKLDPAVFPTAEARSAYFTERLAAEEKHWTRLFTKYSNNECGPSAASSGDCSPEPGPELVEKRDNSVQRIKLMSEQAIVSDKKIEQLKNIPSDVVFPN